MEQTSYYAFWKITGAGLEDKPCYDLGVYTARPMVER